MEKELLTDITAYLDLLNREGLRVTVHDTSGFLTPYAGALIAYNIHSNPYCLLVKTRHEAWEHCIACQKKVAQRASEQGDYFGTCWMGVGEFIFPFASEDAVLGFVSVSGYRSDRARAFRAIDRHAGEYGYERDIYKAAYDRYLTPQLPDSATLTARIHPLCQMLCSLARMRRRLPDAYDPLFSRMLHFLEEHYSGPVSVSDVAHAVGCSPSYASHFFKNKTGQSLISYVLNLRIRAAQRFLCETDLRISDIAGLTGFSDANYFSNTFRRYTGCSPRAYREKQNRPGADASAGL